MIGSKKTLETLKRQIFEAIRSNNIGGVIEILGLEVNINTQDDFGRTPIFLAALYNNLPIVEKLAELGADLEVKSNLGDTVLSKVISKDNPYKKILKREQLAMVRTLIKWGAKPTTSIRGSLPIHIAIQVKCSLDVVKALLTEDTVNKKDIFGYAALHIAVLSNQVNIVELLIKHKSININIQHSTTRDTPLILSARYELIEVAQLLLIHNANPNLKNLYGQTFFGFAVSKEMKSLPAIIKSLSSKWAESENRENLPKPSFSNDHIYAKCKMSENKLPEVSYRSILANLASRHNKLLSFKPSLPTMPQPSMICANSPEPGTPSISSPESGVLSVSSLESSTSDANSPKSSTPSVSSSGSSISEISRFEMLDINSHGFSLSEASKSRRLEINTPESETSRHSTSAILGSPKSTLSEVSQYENTSSSWSSVSECQNISSPGSGISEASQYRNISPPMSFTVSSRRRRRLSTGSTTSSESYVTSAKSRRYENASSYSSIH